MGLLEKALHYKSKINNKGKKSIMDRIQGPADADYTDGKKEAEVMNDNDSMKDIVYLDRNDLKETDKVPENGLDEPALTSVQERDPGKKSNSDHEIAENKESLKTRKPGMEDDISDHLKNHHSVNHTKSAGSNLDFMALYELSRDILYADSLDELFEVILFSVMGQIGCSSSSIMIPSKDDSDEWIIAESQGVTINKEDIAFLSTKGIFNQLITRKESIDIEEFKDKSDFEDDYYSFIAIDGRMLVPLIFNKNVMGAIILGNKLTSEDYTKEEKDFITAIAEFSAMSYRTLLFKERIDGGGDSGSHSADIEKMRSIIVSDSNSERIKDIIRDAFKTAGIESFAVFFKEHSGMNYELFVCEVEDQLKLNDLRFKISADASLVNEIARAESPVIFNAFQRSKPCVEIFSDRQLRNMSMLEIFTFSLKDDFLGFTMIFDVLDQSRVDSINSRIVQFMNVIFPYIAIIREIEYRQGMYIDTIEGVFKRIDDEIKNARNLKIPVTMMLISIKNFKRFHSLFGHEKAKDMFDHFERFIKTRLSEKDFSIRFDRHKILVVLPGKDKKFAVPLGNTICNEMIHVFSTKEAQLLATFVTAEYPVDGKDVYSLIDSLN